MDDLVYFCLAVEACDQNAVLIATIVHTKETLFILTLNHSHILKYYLYLYRTRFIYNNMGKCEKPDDHSVIYKLHSQARMNVAT